MSSVACGSFGLKSKVEDQMVVEGLREREVVAKGGRRGGG